MSRNVSPDERVDVVRRSKERQGLVAEDFDTGVVEVAIGLVGNFRRSSNSNPESSSSKAIRKYPSRMSSGVPGMSEPGVAERYAGHTDTYPRRRVV
jgi:hypothetical protein